MLHLLTSLSTFLKHLLASGMLNTRCDLCVLRAYETGSPDYNDQKPREHMSQNGAGPELDSGGSLTFILSQFHEEFRNGNKISRSWPKSVHVRQALGLFINALEDDVNSGR